MAQSTASSSASATPSASVIFRETLAPGVPRSIAKVNLAIYELIPQIAAEPLAIKTTAKPDVPVRLNVEGTKYQYNVNLDVGIHSPLARNYRLIVTSVSGGVRLQGNGRVVAPYPAPLPTPVIFVLRPGTGKHPDIVNFKVTRRPGLR